MLQDTLRESATDSLMQSLEISLAHIGIDYWAKHTNEIFCIRFGGTVFWVSLDAAMSDVKSTSPKTSPVSLLASKENKGYLNSRSGLWYSAGGCIFFRLALLTIDVLLQLSSITDAAKLGNMISKCLLIGMHSYSGFPGWHNAALQERKGVLFHLLLAMVGSVLR